MYYNSIEMNMKNQSILSFNNITGILVATVLTGVFILVSFSPCCADTYILKNGNRIVGKLLKETDAHYIVDIPDIGELRIAKDSVEQIIKEAAVPEEERIKSLKKIPLDALINQLVQSYRVNPIPKTNPILAIMPFQAKDPDLREQRIGFGVAEVITDSFVQEWVKDFQIVERSKLKESLSEQRLSLTGIISENSAIKTGQLLSADILLLGSVSKMGDNYLINARFVKTDTGKILAAESITSSVKEIQKEAKSYVNLPDNWGFYYGMKSLTLTPVAWTVDTGEKVGGDPIYLTNSADFNNSSISYFVVGYRYFPVKSILLELQIAPNPITNNTYYIHKTVASELYEKQDTGTIYVTASGTVNLAQKIGPSYIYLGAGGTSLEAARNGTRIIPLISGGFEWRFRKRVGIDIHINYLFGNLEFTSADYANDPLYEISPVVVTIAMSFYF